LKPLGLMGQRAREGDPAAGQTGFTEILKDERDITGDTAIQLGKVFKNTRGIWMNLQMTYAAGES
jgi:plasmid maintenance system antidote protein VapI